MNIWITKTPAQIDDASEHSQLKKNLTAVDLAALGIGSVVGTGIFVATGQGAQLAGPGVLLSFIIAAVTCGFCALTYSELACMFPVAGSTYSYSYVAFGEVIAWIIGWDLMLEYLVAASAVASGWSTTFIGLIQSAGVKLPKAILTPPITTNAAGKIVLSGGVVDVPAIVITLLITWILYIGIKESAKINNVIVGVKIAVILLFVFLGIRHVSLANLQPLMPFGWKGVMAGAAIIFFAYIGFDAVSTAAQEARNPQRDMPIGILGSLAICTLLYVIVSAVLVGMVPYKDLNVAAPMALAMQRIGAPEILRVLVDVGAVLGLGSVILVMLLGQSRVFYSMSRDGLLGKWAASVHPRFRTPYLSTIFTGVAVAFATGMLPLQLLGQLVNIGTLLAFVLVSIGVLILRRTRPDLARPFRTPWVPFVPIMGVLCCAGLMATLPLDTWIRLIVWLLIGFAIYFGYSRRHSVLQREMAAGIAQPK